jgi:hypothetical protein
LVSVVLVFLLGCALKKPNVLCGSQLPGKIPLRACGNVLLDNDGDT